MTLSSRHQLILNPTENIPELLKSNLDYHVEGLYIDEPSNEKDYYKAKTVLFSGHSLQQQEIIKSQELWRDLLHAEHLSLRLLSGLHAHTITFMGIGKIGDSVLLLPADAGGHHSAGKILNRLGYNIIEMAVDYENKSIDIPATIEIIKKTKPDFIFIDRSDGLNYEDFSPLTKASNTCNIFDASQYITHIISNQYKSPFEMGFQIMLSTIHKNFPGPQKAFICSKGAEDIWERIEYALNNYISSAHSDNIIHSGKIIENHLDYIKSYGKTMLQNTEILEKELIKYHVPIIKRNNDLPITQQIWISCSTSSEAYRLFKEYERYNILVNYRQLAYKLGFGLRLGTAATTLSGLRPEHCEQLAFYIQAIFHKNISIGFEKEVQQFINHLWEKRSNNL